MQEIKLLKPLPGRVILKRVDGPTTPSPYVVPSTAVEKPVEAEVIAIPSVPTYEYGILIPCPLNVGDKVLVGKYAGDHKFRGEDVTIVRWDEILAIISEENEPDEPAASLNDRINRLSEKAYVDQKSASLPTAADLDLDAHEHRAEELTARFLNKLAVESGQLNAADERAAAAVTLGEAKEQVSEGNEASESSRKVPRR